MVKGLTKEQQIAVAKEIGYFPLRPSYRSGFALMSKEEVGQIANACMDYFERCEDTTFDEEYMKMAWEIFKGDIDQHILEYINEQKRLSKKHKKR